MGGTVQYLSPGPITSSVITDRRIHTISRAKRAVRGVSRLGNPQSHKVVRIQEFRINSRSYPPKKCWGEDVGKRLSTSSIA